MSKRKKAAKKVAERPAESASAGLAAAIVLIAQTLGISGLEETDVSLVILAVGAVPAIITALVNWFRNLTNAA